MLMVQILTSRDVFKLCLLKQCYHLIARLEKAHPDVLLSVFLFLMLHFFSTDDSQKGFMSHCQMTRQGFCF
ncbi:hypothetical protein AB205_0047070 [Aquarana catesbeiana]|uniref:Uncharacterized protein n=1 Tax=Aquarana catesbeiana TaxID=8400 RepID=A0A2G9QGV5_AQUCT|nr:hypothetical protein AB205_0047070 [Aquarana catesbeiana]